MSDCKSDHGRCIYISFVCDDYDIYQQSTCLEIVLLLAILCTLSHTYTYGILALIKENPCVREVCPVSVRICSAYHGFFFSFYIYITVGQSHIVSQPIQWTLLSLTALCHWSDNGGNREPIISSIIFRMFLLQELPLWVINGFLNSGTNPMVFALLQLIWKSSVSTLIYGNVVHDHSSGDNTSTKEPFIFPEREFCNGE